MNSQPNIFLHFWKLVLHYDAAQNIRLLPSFCPSFYYCSSLRGLQSWRYRAPYWACYSQQHFSPFFFVRPLLLTFYPHTYLRWDVSSNQTFLLVFSIHLSKKYWFPFHRHRRLSPIFQQRGWIDDQKNLIGRYLYILGVQLELYSCFYLQHPW